MKNFSLRDRMCSMKTRVFTVFALLVTLALLPGPALASAFSPNSGAVSAQSAPAASMFRDALAIQPNTVAKTRDLEAYGPLPLSFIPNQGQVDERVGYYVQSGGQSLRFTTDGVTMALPETTLRLEFLDANPSARLEGGDKLPGVVNYFIGNDPTKWRTNIPTYGRLTHHDLWPGVDLTYEGRPGVLKSTFTIAPEADPAQIRLAYPDADNLVINGQGNLIISAAGGKVWESVPRAWQEIDGQRVPVLVTYQVAEQSYGFALPEGYDPACPLVIDPELVYSTLLGENNADGAHAIAADGSGAAYVTGSTNCCYYGVGFPTTLGAFSTTYNGGPSDTFVTKLNATGSELVYSTYLGGNGDDEGYGIAVDGSGVAYVTGRTRSSDFPTTPDAFDTTYNGGLEGDVFVTELNAAGSALTYSTFLGGSDGDRGWAIVVDESGAAYVTGLTGSSDFPTTPGAFDTTYNGGSMDAFVTKLNAAGSALAYSTFLGGSGGDYGDDYGNAIAVDGSGAAYVTGKTECPNFPTTPGAFDTTFNGGYGDAFVTKLNAAGSALAYSTFLGGSEEDYGNAIAVDGSGAAYVTGRTYSSNFPTTPGAFDTTHDGNYDDAFVTKLHAAGSALAYSTFLGGSGGDYYGHDGGHAIAVDGSGAAYVTGSTSSSDFPTTSGTFDTTHNDDYDAFITKLNALGNGLVYSTYLGGSDRDYGYGIAMDGSRAVYVAGSTCSSDFPTTPGAFDTTFDGFCDAFVAKLAVEGGPGPTPTPTSTSMPGPTSLLSPPLPTLAGEDFWTTSSLYGYRVNTLTVDPQASSIIYIGTNKWILKSVDGGNTWTALPRPLGTESQHQAQNVMAIAVDPGTPSTIYAADNQLYKTTDGGQTWAAIGTGVLKQRIEFIVIDPKTPSSLYVGTRGGAFKSVDGGSSWAGVGLPTTGQMTALAIDPQTTTTVYAAVQGQGLFKSTDGSSSWALTGGGLPQGVQIFAIEIDPQTSANLFANTNQGLYRSQDSGGNWQKTTPERYRYDALAIDLQKPNVIYLATREGIDRSEDRGSSWTNIKIELPQRVSFTGLIADPKTSGVLYGISNNTVYKSHDGGDSWVAPQLMTGEVSALAAHPESPDIVYAGIQNKGVYKSIDRGQSWQPASNGLPENISVQAFAFDPQDANTIYAGTGKGLFRSIDGGNNWMATGLPENIAVSAIAIDPKTNTNLYVGGQEGILKSVNGGESWAAVSLPQRVSVNALAIDPETPSTLYAGTWAGIFKSTDSGSTWLSVSQLQQFIYEYGYGIDVVLNPETPSHVYVGTLGGVFISTDSGNTWAPRNAGFPENVQVVTMEIEPKDPTILYAGTNHGVFVSPDAGASWVAINQGLGGAGVAKSAVGCGTPPTLFVTLSYYGGTGGVWRYSLVAMPTPPTPIPSPTPLPTPTPWPTPTLPPTATPHLAVATPTTRPTVVGRVVPTVVATPMREAPAPKKAFPVLAWLAPVAGCCGLLLIAGAGAGLVIYLRRKSR